MNRSSGQPAGPEKICCKTPGPGHGWATLGGMTAVEQSRATVVTTRPAGQGVNLCRALRRRGITAWNLPAVRLAPASNPDTVRTALAKAVTGAALIFTSPAAVRHALALRPADAPCPGEILAVGASTARALRRAGLGPVTVPQQASSEGLLALEALSGIKGKRIAIVGAAGGRELLGDSLAERGARVQRVNVYRRLPARLDARHWQAIGESKPPLLVTLTSAQAIGMLAERLPADAWQRLCSGTALASSPRLARLASQLGFAQVRQARSATDAELLAAIDALFSVPWPT